MQVRCPDTLHSQYAHRWLTIFLHPRCRNASRQTVQHNESTVDLFSGCPTAVHMSSSCCILHIPAPALAEHSLGESVTAISPSTLQRPGLSECLEVLLPRERVPETSLCLVPALNRVPPLTASAVTRATTSLHRGPPFTVVRLVRELMSVRVHAVRFLPPARPISCRRKIDSVWSSTDVVHTDLILDKL